MRPSHRRLLPLAAITMLVAGSVCSAQQPQVSVHRVRDQTSLVLAGRPLYSTAAAIVNPRVIVPRNSSTVIALWDEVGAAGGVEHFYGLSLDGGRTLALAEPTTYLVRLVYANFDPVQGEPAVTPELAATANNAVHLVQFVIPPVDEFRRDLTQMGATVEHFLTDHTHVVTMDAKTAARVRALPYVRWVGAYHPAYRLSADIRAQLSAGGTELGAQRYSIECFRAGPAQQQAVADLVRKLGGIVELTSVDGRRMEATLTRSQLLAVAGMNEVNYVDPWGGPGGTDMHVIRQLHGATNAAGEPIGGFSGQGVRGEVFDTEVRVGHVAFQSPAPLLRNNSAGTPGNPHGSSCYGINFADWPANPNYNGMVTSAEQGIFCNYTLASQFGGATTRLVLNTQATSPTGAFKSSYQTSSVGSAQVTAYTTVSAEVDDYLWKVDYLSCQSQSNTGNMNSRPQAWAKNIVSIGGLEWRATLARGDDAWSSASYGPAADLRVKPDLTSCYADIPTTDNSSNSGVTSFGGTSGATPIAAGTFGLLMQMWHEGAFPGFGGGSSVFADRPRSMTAKAMMISNAYRYPLTQGSLNRAKQGWGMPDLANVYNRRNKMHIINETDLLINAQTKTYTVCVQPGETQATFTLCYIDPPGTPAGSQARINDLSLRAVAPDGAIYRGNAGLVTSNFSASGGTADTKDTVENIFVQNPLAGSWTIEVVATAVVADAHLATAGVNDVPYGLVATGVSPPVPIIGLPEGQPTFISPTSPTTVAVRIVSGCQAVIPGSPSLVYRSSPTGSWTVYPLTPVSGDDYLATFPIPSCSDTPQYFFSAAGVQGAAVTLPLNAPTSVFSGQVGDLLVRFADDFESDKNWSGEDPLDTAVTGRWSRNAPQGTEAQPAGDNTPDGSYCWVTDYRAGQQVSDFDVDGGRTTLTSPLIDASNLQAATITYYRWYSNGVGPLNPNTNVFKVDISNNDGASWIPVATIGPAGTETEPGWIKHTFLISTFVTPTATMRVRFIASDVTDSIVEAAIDDFQLFGVLCSAPCYANCDASSGVPLLTANDFQCFINRFAQADPYANCDNSVGSPLLTGNDFTCFINAFAVGCP